MSLAASESPLEELAWKRLAHVTKITKKLNWSHKVHEALHHLLLCAPKNVPLQWDMGKPVDISGGMLGVSLHKAWLSRLGNAPYR